MKQSIFSALSWRVEARAASLSAVDGGRLRNRCGNAMRLLGAHRTLPDIPDRAVILCFHGVTERRLDPDIECDVLTLPAFRQLLDVLDRSFNVVSLAEMVEALVQGHALPPRCITITFDDGYANNARLAAEELAARKMPWSVFLPAGLIESGGWQWVDDVRVLLQRGSRKQLQFHWEASDLLLDLRTPKLRLQAVRTVHEACRYVSEAVRRIRLGELYACYSEDEIASAREQYPAFAPMTWNQARELQSAGVDIGNHSYSHIALAPQPTDLIHQEVASARDLIQQRLGGYHPHFSYPYGRPEAISPQAEAIIREAGYRCAVTLEQNTIDFRHPNLLQLPRLIVSTDVGRVLFGLWQRFIR
ncbi:MAG: polysaccharide deacetylase family protein [Phycisphaerales bacterium]|nr:polysaccharide deacetylase family protein [Phycisphaerales bacterium]